MSEVQRVRVHKAEKVSVFTIVNKRSFGMIPKAALSMGKDCGPLEEVKVLSSTLVK
jgi:hypothetical protein